MTARKLGFWSASSLVLGNMIGSGIFMLPAALAVFGKMSLPAWALSASGALLLAFVFRSLSKKFPKATGGPYAYTREGLGEFPAYLVAWGYWISIWSTNAAIAVAFVSYLTVFFPTLEQHVFLSVFIGLSAVWFLTWLNTRRITVSGRLQTITTAIKIIPLLAIGIFGLFYIDLDYIWVEPEGDSSWFSILTAATTLTLFAFLGLESATIPADNIRDAKNVVPRATLFGTVAAIIIYILSSTVVMGLIPPESLKTSPSPFADAAALMWGENARYLVAIGAIISTFGALNGWILMQGQVPAAAASDGIFPKVFARKNRFGMPTTGPLISSVLVSVMIALNFTNGFVDTFRFILLLSTLMALLPYLFATTSYMLLLVQEKSGLKKHAMHLFLGLLAFLFIIWAIAGSGEASVYWGFILLLCGIPGYIWIKRNSS